HYLSGVNSSDTLLCPSASSEQYCFDALARLTEMPAIGGEAQSLLADWRLINTNSNTPQLAREQERLLVLLMAGLVLSLVSMFFYFLVKRVRRRIFPLIDAANAVSAGEW
ncbi:MAG TPA: hypothetical protein DCS35_02125, partial [Vibrio sp.]|nr:hypothetical protein [Vibrio sp.]